MTGNDPADYGDECTAAGMDGFLMKPVSLERLRAVLGDLGGPAPEATPAAPSTGGADRT